MANKLLPIIFFLSVHISSFVQSWQSLPDVPLDFVFPLVVELRGDIHVMGGGTNGIATDLHVRYSPATNTWDTLAPVPYRAQQPAGAVVAGKIHYCGGGFPTSGQRLNFHYYYDVDSNAWYPADTLPVAVAIHKCVELDGKLFVLSGQPDKTLCESYDPATDSWTQKNPLPDMNFWYGVIVSAAGSIYRFGGGGYISPTAAAHVYDKVNDSWTSIPSLPMALHGAAGANVGDSLIWILGGYNNGNDQDKVWIYNINSQTYSLTDSLPVARSYLSSVNAGGCIYSVGGNNNGVPQVGVSLLQNCTPNFPAVVNPILIDNTKPYSILATSSYFQLRLNVASGIQYAAVRLIDMTGKTVLSNAPVNGDHPFVINGNGLSTGMYLVLISSGSNSWVEQWMVAR